MLNPPGRLDFHQLKYSVIGYDATINYSHLKPISSRYEFKVFVLKVNLGDSDSDED